MDWIDKRPLDTLLFGGMERDMDMRRVVADFVRSAFQRAGVAIAEDIARVGCTTLVKLGYSIDDIGKIRMGLAGSGCGLPCFVPPDRFCLAHQTIGGLQEDQVPLDPEFVASVSRELTAKERGHVELVDRARHVNDEKNRVLAAKEMLAGRKLPDDMQPEDGSDGSKLTEPKPESKSMPEPDEKSWTCPEHTETHWTCRFCVAAEIVAGPLQPEFVMFNDAEPNCRAVESMEDVDELIDESDADDVRLYVFVASWSRRLSRNRDR